MDGLLFSTSPRQTCQIARHASKIDLIWEIKILQTFGIDVKKANSPGPSARVFYQKVLYNYGVLIGLWQATTFGLYGGLFQVSFMKSLEKIYICQIKAYKNRFVHLCMDN